MSMDIDDDAASCRHPHRCDSVQMNPPGSPSERTPFDDQELVSIQTSIRSRGHAYPDYDRLPGLDDPPQLVLASSSSENRPGEMGDVYENHVLAGQHRPLFPGLKPSPQEITSRKRKFTHDLPDTHATNNNDTPDDDAFADSANSQSRRRIRPRLQTQREFSPLLIMPLHGEQDTVVEDTVSALRYGPNPSHSIQRYFHHDNPAHGPRILQRGSLPRADDLEDPNEPPRSNSVSSFVEVALASTATRRLSSLQDLELPRPFEEAERPSSCNIAFSERGLDAPLSFHSVSGGRMGSLRGSREMDTHGHPIRPSSHEHGSHAVSPRSTLFPLEPTTTNFFGKPLCESPDSISPDGDGPTPFEPPTRVIGSSRST